MLLETIVGVGMHDLSGNDLDRYSKSLLAILVVIVVLGVIMVYSASYIYAKELFFDSAYFLKKQLFFTVIAGMFAWLVSKTKIKFWIKYAFFFNIFCTTILFLTFIPGVGVNVKGASRWINIGFINFQPGEFIKASLLLASIYFFEKFKFMKRGEIVKNVVFLLLPMIFLLKQPDFGTFLICLLVVLFAAFMSSFPKKYFYFISLLGFSLIFLTLFIQPYRVKRILAFLDPWKNAKTSGFQVIQSYLAFANGSFWGAGLGNSKEKLFYLPEAHNDFIFSVVGEELGFLGIVFTISLFLLFIYCGLKLAVRCRDRWSTLLISSIVFIIGLQVVINMGVVMGVLPTKGLNLPFISYGGSSMVANFFAVGLVLSSVRYCKSFEKM